MSATPVAPARRPALAIAALAGAAILAGCATTPTTAPVSTVVPGGTDRARAYADALAAAQQATAAGRLREALWRWRIVEAVAPDRVAGARASETAQARLTAAADAAEQDGARAVKSGHAAEAQAAYAHALDLDPQRPEARTYMRSVLATQVMADVNRLAGSEPKAKTGGKPKGKLAHPSRRAHAKG